MGRRFFTLIELLIVVAIILILLSLLQPALRLVLKQAKVTLCMNNMKQNYLVMMSYAGDHHDKVWDSDWHDGYGLSPFRFKHSEEEGPIPEGEFSGGNDPYDMRKYILEYTQGVEHEGYVAAVTDDKIDLPTWTCPEVESVAIDEKVNSRFACYYNYMYFPGNRYPFVADAPDPNGLIDDSWTNLPRKLSDLSNFVIQQDLVLQFYGRFAYNHGIDDDFRFVPDSNPSATWRMDDSAPEGAVLSWGDGHVRWVDFLDLVDVGRGHVSFPNDIKVYSLPPGQ